MSINKFVDLEMYVSIDLYGCIERRLLSRCQHARARAYTHTHTLLIIDLVQRYDPPDPKSAEQDGTGSPYERDGLKKLRNKLIQTGSQTARRAVR